MGVIKMPITIKAIGYPGGVVDNKVSVDNFDELDSWILENIDPSGRYEICRAGSAQVVTAENFDHFMEGTCAKVVHVRPQATAAQPVAWEVPQAACSGRLAPPREVAVRQASDGSAPVASWKPPDGGPVVSHYEVKVVSEASGDQGSEEVLLRANVQVPAQGRNPQFQIHGAMPGLVLRVEVAAVDVSGITGKGRSAQFYVEERLKEESREATRALEQASGLLKPYCEEFEKTHFRSPLFLVIGKQHHGKSSLINHFKRCLSHKMDIPDEVEAAPPSENETTIRTKTVKVDFYDHSFTFCDVPAFSTMNEERKRDLNNLLWRVSSDWARGEESWWPAAKPPDAAIVVVSLMSWRDEHDSLRDYLRELQAVLKHQHRSNRWAVFPFVVAATHKDKFLEEEGNRGRDPIEELKMAEAGLKAMANTNHVFVMHSYDHRAWWAPSVTENTYRMLREVTNLGKNRTQTLQECVWSNHLMGGAYCAVREFAHLTESRPWFTWVAVSVALTVVMCLCRR